MNQEKVQNYSGIITKVGSEIMQSAYDDYQIIEMISLDNQHYLKTYQIRLFGNKMRCDLKQGDLAVFKNGLLYSVSENTIFLSSNYQSQILIGENEILNDQDSDILNKLKFMEQQFQQQQQQQQQYFYNNQHQLQNFQGIICKKGNIKVKQINGYMQEVKGIQFINIDEQGHFQLYKIKLVGVRAHQIVRISQKILIKNASIREIKGQYKILNYSNGQDATQIFVGQEIIKKNCGKNEYKRFIAQMDRKVDEMNTILQNMQIRRASKKIKKNF